MDSEQDVCVGAHPPSPPPPHPNPSDPSKAEVGSSGYFLSLQPTQGLDTTIDQFGLFTGGSAFHTERGPEPGLAA